MADKQIKKSTLIDDIIIATSCKKEDEKIIELCKSLDIKYWSGSENDVLKEYMTHSSQVKRIFMQVLR